MRAALGQRAWVDGLASKGVCVCGGGLVTQSCPVLCDPMDCSPPGGPFHGILQQEYWSGLPFPLSGYLPDPGIEPRSSALQADSLPSEPPGY